MSVISEQGKVYLQQAKEVLEIEANSVLQQCAALGEDFVKAVELILNCRSRVIVTGMGKSGLVGRKIAATLASTGTPAIFLHPAEGIHGDLGMVTTNDVVIALSNSGETAEVLAVLPSLKVMGTPIIAIVSDKNSTLAKNSEIVLQVKVEREACPLGLAPTASTTASLAVGDALAVVLLQARHFAAKDFALFHPGGMLGRKLLLTVEQVMRVGEENPLILPNSTVRDAVIAMTAQGNLGAALVVDENKKLLGIITDGDLRRVLGKYDSPLEVAVDQVMTANPKKVTKEKMAAEAMKIMEGNGRSSITVLPVVDEDNLVVGVIHLHDIIKEMTGMHQS